MFFLNKWSDENLKSILFLLKGLKLTSKNDYGCLLLRVSIMNYDNVYAKMFIQEFSAFLRILALLE